MASKFVSSCGLFVALALLLVSVAGNSEKECTTFKAENEKLIKMVFIASEMRYKATKKNPSCILFKESVLEVASKEGLVEAKTVHNNLSQYKQIIRMIEARTDCLEGLSRIGGAGLRSLLSFMKNCADEIGSNQSTDEQLIEQLETANRELREQLAAKEALLQQVSGPLSQSLASEKVADSSKNERSIFHQIDALNKQNELCKQQLENLASANDALHKQVTSKNELETILYGQIHRLQVSVYKTQEDLTQMEADRYNYKILAEVNAAKLQNCLNYKDMKDGS